MDAADRVLEKVKPRLRTATPEQLIAGLRSNRPSNDVEYLVWRDGNKLVEEELVRRGAAARDALQRHAEDERQVWTGVNGPLKTVGSICTQVLEQLNGGGSGGAI